MVTLMLGGLRALCGEECDGGEYSSAGADTSAVEAQVPLLLSAGEKKVPKDAGDS